MFFLVEDNRNVKFIVNLDIFAFHLIALKVAVGVFLQRLALEGLEYSICSASNNVVRMALLVFGVR